MSFTTRPELRGTFGMVASTHWLASGAGMAVLERGGNAFDAAVAAGFVLQVVEPHLNGPGGDVPAVVIAVMGALVPEAVQAADVLREEAGAEVEVVCITSADLLYRSFQARAGLGEGDPGTLDRLFPHAAPVVTLLDGHPHTLSFIGDACLGVQRFGQSGDLAELYEHHAIDAESVVGAALDLLDA